MGWGSDRQGPLTVVVVGGLSLLKPQLECSLVLESGLHWPFRSLWPLAVLFWGPPGWGFWKEALCGLDGARIIELGVGVVLEGQTGSHLDPSSPCDSGPWMPLGSV